MNDWGGPVAVGRAARGTVAQSVGRIAVVAVQAVLIAILARGFDPDVFSAFVAATALLGIVDVVAEFGTTTTAVVEMGKRPSAVAAIARATQRANLLMLSCAVALSIPFLVFGYSTDARLSYACLLPATIVNRFASSHMAVRRHRLELSRLAIAEIAGRSLTVVLAVPLLVVSWSVDTGLAAVGVAYFVGAIATFLIVRTGQRGSGGAGMSTGRQLLRAAAPLGLTGAISFVHVRADQVLLEVLDRTEDLGAYAIAYRVLEGAAGVLALAGGGMLAVLARAAPEDRPWLAGRSVAVVDALGVVATCAVLVTARPIGRILGGSQLTNTDALIALIAPLVWVSSINAIFASVAIVSGRASRLLRIAVAGTILNVGGCLAVIPTWGAKGAAVVTLTTEVFGLALVAREATRIVPMVGVTRRLVTGVLLLGVVMPAWYLVWQGRGVVWFAVAVSTLVVLATVMRNRTELVAAGRRVLHSPEVRP